ncbi:TonB-dependent receptor [Sphingomonas sp. EC-HK361]|uniref:TonB-dependent receptor domain-containing protein n=1 Tax=Sphingomonas sp. EC-HK361 TaxID=2038397 RepID=UPI00125C6DB0|nr:TonB-dependent receptor [Sphingomonas sp. EC-HK361]VVT14657.1 TonB-dependent receptor [Sphingomonas sp. EC-HK361]
MRISSLLSTTALYSAAASGLFAALTATAEAQSVSAAATETGDSDAPPLQTSPPPAEEAQTGEIVVTGSRIRRTDLESAVPLVAISGDAFYQTGRSSIGDVLNDLPSLTSTFSQSNSSRFLGTAGLSLLDLRGLGTERTLVLVNGRRHVAGDILNNAVSTDINTIPTDLIERVEIVTGGSSAVYGSDAISGVVNFILKDHYRGLQLRGQGSISQYGDAGNYYLSALGGVDFGDGRGNIALNVEYAHQNDFYASARKDYRHADGFITVDTDPFDAVNGSDGVPDNLFYRDIRSGTFSNGGTFLSYLGGDSYAPFLFQPDGTLIPQTGQAVGLPPLPSYIGGNGSTFREGRQLGLLPKLDRYSANLVAHFEISEAFVPFIEAKYVRTDSLGNASGPFFFSGGTTGSPRERFFTDNPYLTDQARGIIRDFYGDTSGAFDAEGNPIPNGINDADEQGFTFIRNVVELTNREEAARRETYRIVAGIRGKFNTDWGYELSANYGEFVENTRILGNVNLQRFLLAIDAVDAGRVQTGTPNGQIVCRASIDPAARIAYEGATDPVFAAGQLATDVAACVPINLFGEGNITDAARRYLLQDSFARGKITQFVLSGFVNGDTSEWFNLPGGPIGFAIGAEYRRETVSYRQDQATAAGLTFYNALPPFTPPAFEVKEVFGEVRLPILKNVPFFQQLSMNGAFRVADYKGATGTVASYGGGVEWAPVADLRFRANYARAVRAPNLVNLYSPLGQNFALVNDPCSARNIGTGSTTRPANCAAAGVPAGYDFVYQQSLAFQSGGNQALKAERSDSYTLGLVFQPRVLRNFALTVDYFDITVNKVITSPNAQDILDACYDAADLNNQFCGLFTRNAGPGLGPRGEIPGQILENSLKVIPLNYAKLKVRGIDFDASYSRKLGNIGDLSLRGIYTLSLQNDTFLSPTDPNRANQQLLELGFPKHEFTIDTALKTGPLTIGYKVRYIGKMVLNEYEDTFSKQGRPPQNADYADRRFYPDVAYHNIRFDIQVKDRMNFYAGVDNVTNRKPPLGLTGSGFGSGIYDNVGRLFYAGAVVKFG